MNGGRSLTGILATATKLAAIGEPLERIRSELIAWGHEIRGYAEPAYISAIEEAIRYLERQSCRVAVIGQVKAGKSSFINALVGRPDLLPSNVNPWTAVVTNLHFYRANPQQESASFAFFGADEWHRIAESGGPLRELTERLVPGFDPQLLNAQLQTMRLRAAALLGDDFEALLGQSHSYPTLSHNLLAQYICSPIREGEPGPACYSDITKSADLYFGSERSGFPLTLVDTPGTNDPLLVRDEITRQSLASADIYIVVLTAQQPLAIGDLALLRLLRGLHKERIVIFINRIDGLQDIAGDTRLLVAHVEARLREEFPETKFPIIAGSALWANCAMAQSSAELARPLEARFRAYASALGLGNIEAPVAGRRPPPEAQAALLAASGAPAIMRVLEQLLMRGNAAVSVRQLATLFLQIARSSEVTSRAQSKALARALREATSSTQNRAVEVQSWSRELDELEATSRELQSNLKLYEASLHAQVERCAADLQLLLRRCLTGFTERQVALLAQAWRANSTAVWVCDTRPLRDALQDEFLRVYRFWEERLAHTDELMSSQLEAVVPRDNAMVADSMPKVIRNSGRNQPSVAALSQIVALDLSGPWWRAWWSGRPSLESRVAELRRLIQAEFEPTIESLIGEAVAVLGERSRFAARQAQIGTLDIINDIHRRSTALVAGLQQVGAGATPDAVAQLEQQARECEARVVRWGEVRTALAGLAASCETIMGVRQEQ